LRHMVAYYVLGNALARAGFTKENHNNDHIGRHDFIQKEHDAGKSAREIMEEVGHHRLAELRSYVHL
jgi:hypothetical protein